MGATTQIHNTRMSYRHLSIFCTTCFLTWAWLGMSNMDYRIGDRTNGMTTAFYFYVGLPILGAIGYFSTIPFELLSRRFRRYTGWSVAACVYVLILSFTYCNVSPRARMQWALGIDVPAEVELRRLVQRDSFNDGITVWGFCTATPSFFDQVANKNNLTPAMNSYDFRLALGIEDLPEDGWGCRGGLMQMYFNEDGSLLYFSRHGSESAP